MSNIIDGQEKWGLRLDLGFNNGHINNHDSCILSGVVEIEAILEEIGENMKMAI